MSLRRNRDETIGSRRTVEVRPTRDGDYILITVNFGELDQLCSRFACWKRVEFLQELSGHQTS